MAISDHFELVPPIPCPHCGGPMEGWRGSPSGDGCYIVWRQGETAPIDQRINPDLRLDDASLSSRRLERACIPISGGECKDCGAEWRDSQFSIVADARSGTWTANLIEPAPLAGSMLEGGWIQCPLCADAHPIRDRQPWVICEPCGRLIARKPES